MVLDSPMHYPPTSLTRAPFAARESRNQISRSVWSARSLLPLSNAPRAQKKSGIVDRPAISESGSKLRALQTLRAVPLHGSAPVALRFHWFAFPKCWLSVLLLSLLLAALPAKASLILQIGQNFTASTYGIDSDAYPPDAALAASSNYVVEFINGRFSVFNKTNSTPLQTMSDLSFWINAGVTFEPGVCVSDPRLFFDPASQRWFAAMIDFDAGLSNRFLLAISSTADPTGAWNGLAFVADPVDGNFADYPTLGFDRDGVYLGADMWNVSSNIGSMLVSIPKSDLLRIPPKLDGLTRFGRMSYDTYGEILQPVVTWSGTAINAGVVLAVGSAGWDCQEHSNLVTCSIQNSTLPGGATITAPTNLFVPGYSIPFNPLQPSGQQNLCDGDASFSATVYRLGNILYAVHSTQMADHVAIQWFQINARNSTVLATGIISDPNLDLFYPAIAASSSGAVVIVCNGSSLSTYVSCYAIVGEPINGTLTFDRLVSLQSGLASYNPKRWGDYSCICPDPANPARFWALTLYPANSSVWATQITELITTQVQLSIAAAGTNVLISWPAAAASFQLQSATSLSDTNWPTVAQPPVLSNGQFSVSLPAIADSCLFRLFR